MTLHTSHLDTTPGTSAVLTLLLHTGVMRSNTDVFKGRQEARMGKEL